MHVNEVDAPIYGCFATDMPNFLCHLEKLHQKPIKYIYLGADIYGQQFFKLDFALEWGEATTEAPAPTARDEALGGHSRRRVIIVAAVPLLHETYENL